MSRVGLVPILLIAACAGPRQARAPSPDRPHLVVMSYNVNFGLAGDKEALQAIADADADLVLLQETTAAWEAAIRAQLGVQYPHMEFHHCCGAGGLAVLSKRGFHALEVLPAEQGWFPALRVVADSPLGPIQVLDVHLRPPVSDGGSFVSGYFSTKKIRKAEITGFAKQLAPELPTLVVGDFNEDEGGSAVEHLVARGYKSVLPELRTDATTWRWPTPVGELEGRLDHILYDPKLEPLDARALEKGRSDHLPVVALFELSAGVR